MELVKKQVQVLGGTLKSKNNKETAPGPAYLVLRITGRTKKRNKEGRERERQKKERKGTHKKRDKADR